MEEEDGERKQRGTEGPRGGSEGAWRMCVLFSAACRLVRARLVSLATRLPHLRRRVCPLSAGSGVDMFQKSPSQCWDSPAVWGWRAGSSHALIAGGCALFLTKQLRRWWRDLLSPKPANACIAICASSTKRGYPGGCAGPQLHAAAITCDICTP